MHVSSETVTEYSRIHVPVEEDSGPPTKIMRLHTDSIHATVTGKLVHTCTCSILASLCKL